MLISKRKRCLPVEQYQITEQADLLNEEGTLKQAGWAKDLLLRYDRRKIKAPKFRIKEWDYYYILNESYGAAFTIADNGYLGFVSVTLFDFKEPKETTKTTMTLFPLGSFNMPSTSKEGDVVFQNKDISLKFLRRQEQRIISVDIPSFTRGNSLSGNIILHQPPSLESMAIATPFPESKHAFYYNQKINCLPAEGELSVGEQKFSFQPKNSFGVLDWGRGVWTYSNTWYWGSASGIVENESFGFNIGYGFGDTSRATENMLFYKGKAHKLEEVEFHIPPDNYLKPWTFTSSDSRFEMTFQPIIDRYSNTNLLILQSNQHQVFGHFSGKATLDNGQEIRVRNLLGFAEKVYNRW
jgi:hypothetical protein